MNNFNRDEMNNFNRDEIRDIIEIESRKYDLNICGGWIRFRSAVASKILHLREKKIEQLEISYGKKIEDLLDINGQLEIEIKKLKANQVVIAEGEIVNLNYEAKDGSIYLGTFLYCGKDNVMPIGFIPMKILEKNQGKQVKLILQIKE